MNSRLVLALLTASSLSIFAQQTPQQIAEAELPSLLTIYKDLHTHPELSTHEERSAAIVAKELKAAGYEVTEKVGKYDKPGLTCYGVIGVMKNGDGPTVAIRTDLDGLPVREETGVPYASTVTTKNDAGGSAEPSTTRFYLSTNTTLDAADVGLGTRAVPLLAGGASSAAATSVTVPSGTATGTYYILALADAPNTIGESLETNNTRTSAALKVGPDLVVTSISLPAVAAAGTSINVGDTTANQGAGSAAASSTGFYLSTNSVFDAAADRFLGSRAVAELAGGATSAITIFPPSNRC